MNKNSNTPTPTSPASPTPTTPSSELKTEQISPTSDSSLSSSNSTYQFNTKHWPTDKNNLSSIFEEIHQHSIELPCTIFENVTYEEFAALQESEERLAHYLDFDESSQRINIVELPCTEHEILTTRVQHYLCNEYPTLSARASSFVYYMRGKKVEPDQSCELNQIESHPRFLNGRLLDAERALAPALVIEAIYTQPLTAIFNKFIDKYFQIEGCRVGVIIDFHDNNIRMYKVTRDPTDNHKLRKVKSIDGVITIKQREIYPNGYKHNDIIREDLPNITIDLKSPFYDMVYLKHYNGFFLDGKPRTQEEPLRMVYDGEVEESDYQVDDDEDVYED